MRARVRAKFADNMRRLGIVALCSCIALAVLIVAYGRQPTQSEEPVLAATTTKLRTGGQPTTSRSDKPVCGVITVFPLAIVGTYLNVRKGGLAKKELELLMCLLSATLLLHAVGWFSAAGCDQAQDCFKRYENEPVPISWDGLVSRRFALMMAPGLHSLQATPNHVTILGIVIKIVVVLSVVYGRLRFAMCSFVFERFLDCLDGTMARMFQLFSDHGEGIDHATDAVYFSVWTIYLLYQTNGKQRGPIGFIISAFVLVPYVFGIEHSRLTFLGSFRINAEDNTLIVFMVLLGLFNPYLPRRDIACPCRAWCVFMKETFMKYS